MAICRECGAELIVGDNWHLPYARQNSRICIECNKAYNRRWYDKHRQKVLAARPQYYRENRERILAYSHQRYKEHQEEATATSRQYNQDHREERTAYSREWRRKNPEKRAAQKHRRYAREKGAIIGSVDERALYELYNFMCIYCGAMTGLTLDHVIALNNGGLHHEDNLVVACRSCNSSKQDKSLEEWLQTQPNARAWVM